jgi:hypothetical protein
MPGFLLPPAGRPAQEVGGLRVDLARPVARAVAWPWGLGPCIMTPQGVAQRAQPIKGA